MRENKGLGAPAAGAKSFERPRQGARAILKHLWRYLSGCRLLLTFAVLISVVSNLLALVGPKLSGYAVDALRPGAGKVDFGTVFKLMQVNLIHYSVKALPFNLQPLKS